jgi:hypothetical protein
MPLLLARRCGRSPPSPRPDRADAVLRPLDAEGVGHDVDPGLGRGGVRLEQPRAAESLTTTIQAPWSIFHSRFSKMQNMLNHAGMNGCVAHAGWPGTVWRGPAAWR